MISVMLKSFKVPCKAMDGPFFFFTGKSAGYPALPATGRQVGGEENRPHNPIYITGSSALRAESFTPCRSSSQLHFHAEGLPKHQQIKNDETPSPEEKTPEALRGGYTPHREDTVPVDESQDKNKNTNRNDRPRKKESSRDKQTRKEERDETTDPMVLLLKFLHLERLLLYDFGVELLFCTKIR